jgi:hypothetical protein
MSAWSDFNANNYNAANILVIFAALLFVVGIGMYAVAKRSQTITVALA